MLIKWKFSLQRNYRFVDYRRIGFVLFGSNNNVEFCLTTICCEIRQYKDDRKSFR